MYKIGVISDTHGLLRPEVVEILRGCEAILHGGDINRQSILDELGRIAPVYVVRGNNDREWAEAMPKERRFRLHGVSFYMVHDKKMLPKDREGIDVFVYGHSHKYEEKYFGSQLFLNPGSCGPGRFSLPVTLAILKVGEDGSFHVEKIEIPRQRSGRRTGQNLNQQETPVDMRKLIERVMRDTDKHVEVEKIAAKNGVSKELAEQICRLYLTHPGVDAEGIMSKIL